MTGRITKEALRALAAKWIESGCKVIAPVEIKPGTALFTALANAEALLPEGRPRPSNSIKEAVFPRHEVLYSYIAGKDGVELTDAPAEVQPQVVIGAHPCDAAALPILDRVFNWDFRDEQYNRRRGATTVVTLACTAHDEHCFCTRVGLGPDSNRGSDVMLFELTDGAYEFETVTERGAALFEGAEVTNRGGERLRIASPAPKFDPARAGSFAEASFASPVLAAECLACLGCGACAYTCPVCHCFDIVDEGRAGRGVRARNWDACQFPVFTLHASGHNPRRSQGDRQRQRLYHKFFVYPRKFGELLCTGCGNCARNCPAGLGVMPLVERIADAEPVQA